MQNTFLYVHIVIGVAVNLFVHTQTALYVKYAGLTKTSR